MAAKRRPMTARGGLDDLLSPGLLPGGAEAPGEEAGEAALDDLRPNPFQPRRSFDDAALRDLAASLRTHGVLQPLVVRARPEGGYEIAAGERRARAARLAGLASVPIVVRALTDAQMEDVALVENLSREDLNPVDEVDAVVRLAGRALGIPASEVPARLAQLERHPDEAAVGRLDALFSALALGSWRSYRKNRFRVLNWPTDVLDALRAGRLGFYVAAEVAAARDDAVRARLLALAVSGATVEEVRAAALQARPAKSTSQEEARLARVAKLMRSKAAVAALPPTKQRRVHKLAAELEALLTPNGTFDEG